MAIRTEPLDVYAVLLVTFSAPLSPSTFAVVIVQGIAIWQCYYFRISLDQSRYLVSYVQYVLQSKTARF